LEYNEDSWTNETDGRGIQEKRGKEIKARRGLSREEKFEGGRWERNDYAQD
jgi:hypothetical protein